MNEEKDDLKIYEIGFHIIPTIATENIGAEFSQIKSIIEKNGGIFLSEDFPKLRQLAYQFAKKTHGGKQKYDRAYFGWIKFQAEPQAATEIKKAIDLLENVLRFIIIKTVKENILYTPRPSYLRADPNRIARRNKEEKEKAEKPISEAELDKTIEELVVQ